MIVNIGKIVLLCIQIIKLPFGIRVFDWVNKCSEASVFFGVWIFSWNEFSRFK